MRPQLRLFTKKIIQMNPIAPGAPMRLRAAAPRPSLALLLGLLPLLGLGPRSARSEGGVGARISEDMPLQATLDLSACASAGDGAPQVVRVDLPPGLRAEGRPSDGTDLVVVGPQGQKVRAAFTRESPEPERKAVSFEPSTDPTQYLIPGFDRPIDGLRLELGGRRRLAVTAQVWRRSPQGLVPHGDPTLLWRTDEAEQVSIRFPPTRDPLELRLQWHHGYGGRDIRAERLLRRPEAAQPTTLRLPVQSSWVDEGGSAHYTVALPHPIGGGRLRLLAQGSVFSREVELFASTGSLGGPESLGRGRVERILLGDAVVDQQQLQLSTGTASDRLDITVFGEGLEPLTIPEVELELPGESLLLYEPPQGALQLFGGGPTGASTLDDVRVAGPELGRLVQCAATVGPVLPNPAWVAPEVASGLMEAGQSLDAAGFRMRWAVPGGSGLSIIPLPTAVALASRRELADLRLLDSEGRQLPYLLRQQAQRRVLEGVEFERQEDGSTTRIVIKNPEPDVILEAVTLRTTAPVFDRGVSLQRPAGGSLEVLRSASWRWSEAAGAEMPAEGRRFVVSIGQAVGDTLVLSIDNGDDAPLPFEGVELSVVGSELITMVPEGGATLYVGHRSLGPPDHDIGMLTRLLWRRDMQTVTLGEGQRVELAPMTGAERAAVWGGLLGMIAGMGFLIVRLARSAPQGDEATAAPASEA